MMAELTKLVSDRDRHAQDARALLMEAMDEGFEAVVVVGVRADKEVSCKSSKCMSTLMLLGALEWAKEVVLKNWK